MTSSLDQLIQQLQHVIQQLELLETAFTQFANEAQPQPISPAQPNLERVIN